MARDAIVEHTRSTGRLDLIGTRHDLVSDERYTNTCEMLHEGHLTSAFQAEHPLILTASGCS